METTTMQAASPFSSSSATNNSTNNHSTSSDIRNSSPPQEAHDVSCSCCHNTTTVVPHEILLNTEESSTTTAEVFADVENDTDDGDETETDLSGKEDNDTTTSHDENANSTQQATPSSRRSLASIQSKHSSNTSTYLNIRDGVEDGKEDQESPRLEAKQSESSSDEDGDAGFLLKDPSRILVRSNRPVDESFLEDSESSDDDNSPHKGSSPLPPRRRQPIRKARYNAPPRFQRKTIYDDTSSSDDEEYSAASSSFNSPMKKTDSFVTSPSPQRRRSVLQTIQRPSFAQTPPRSMLKQSPRSMENNCVQTPQSIPSKIALEHATTPDDSSPSPNRAQPTATPQSADDPSSTTVDSDESGFALEKALDLEIESRSPIAKAQEENAALSTSGSNKSGDTSGNGSENTMETIATPPKDPQPAADRHEETRDEQECTFENEVLQGMKELAICTSPKDDFELSPEAATQNESAVLSTDVPKRLAAPDDESVSTTMSDTSKSGNNNESAMAGSVTPPEPLTLDDNQENKSLLLQGMKDLVIGADSKDDTFDEPLQECEVQKDGHSKTATMENAVQNEDPLKTSKTDEYSLQEESNDDTSVEQRQQKCNQSTYEVDDSEEEDFGMKDLTNQAQALTLYESDSQNENGQLTGNASLQGPSDDEAGDCEIEKTVAAPLKKVSHTKRAFLKRREALAESLLCEFDRKVFGSRLAMFSTPLRSKLVTLVWAKKLKTTAGRTLCRVSKKTTPNPIRHCTIELSTKVLDCETRLRSTLAHELCHAAEWIVDQSSPGHRAGFKKWSSRVMDTYPDITVTTLHNYVVAKKFSWKCSGCPALIQRNQRDAIDPTRQVCARCSGKLVAQHAPRKPLTAYQLFVQEQMPAVQKYTPLSQRMTEIARLWHAHKQSSQNECG